MATTDQRTVADKIEDAKSAERVNRFKALREEEKLEKASWQKVIVKDIEMPFGSMVVFMIKWAVATIPAAIFLAICGFILLRMFAEFGSKF